MQFEEMAKKHHRWMINLGYYYTQDSNACFDAAQDAWERAWRAFSEYEDVGKEKSWLGSILKRALLNTEKASKATKRIQKPASVEELLEAGMETGMPLSQEGEWDPLFYEFGDELTKAMSTLKPVDQEIMKMAYVDLYTNEEIAQFFNIPICTVKSKQFRAKERLRKALVVGKVHPT
jgi:RNA polymerase sigma factor (sigma-70 family)